MMSSDKSMKMTEMTKADVANTRIEEALSNFRASVHAWSQAAHRQSALVVAPAPDPFLWRRTLAWALGVLLTVGAASGAVYEHHHQQVLAWQAHQRQMEQERVLAAKRAAEMDELMAKVDQDVSQEVPDALEPLARMMTEENGSK